VRSEPGKQVIGPEIKMLLTKAVQLEPDQPKQSASRLLPDENPLGRIQASNDQADLPGSFY
jgi:hypothetical protein